MTDAQQIDYETLAKRMFWLAYQASIPIGLGVLHYTEDLTEDDIWQSVSFDGKRVDRPAADYVSGRMMKMWLENKDGEVSWGPAAKPDPEYQSWCRRHPTYEALREAAIESLT